MRISDWSSDVCSSDLRLHSRRRRSMLVCHPRLRNGRTAGFRQSATRTRLSGSNGNPVLTPIEVAPPENITSPRGRKSVVSGKRVSVRVELGGRRYHIKKKDTLK